MHPFEVARHDLSKKEHRQIGEAYAVPSGPSIATDDYFVPVVVRELVDLSDELFVLVLGFRREVVEDCRLEQRRRFKDGPQQS